MALEEQDIQHIQKIVGGEVEKLAVAVAKGFEEVHEKLREHDKRFESIDKRFESIESSLRTINSRLDLVETSLKELQRGHNQLFTQVQRIDDNLAELSDEVKAIRKQLTKSVSRQEVGGLEERVTQIEKQLELAQ